MLGICKAVKRTMPDHRDDAPTTVDDAGRHQVTAAEITEDTDDFAAIFVVVAGLAVAKSAFREAAVPGEIGGFRGDNCVHAIAAELLDQHRKAVIRRRVAALETASDVEEWVHALSDEERVDRILDLLTSLGITDPLSSDTDLEQIAPGERDRVGRIIELLRLAADRRDVAAPE